MMYQCINWQDGARTGFLVMCIFVNGSHIIYGFEMIMNIMADFHKGCASSFSQMFVKHFMDFCTPLTEFEARIDAVSVVQHPGTLQYLIFIFNIYSN